jgi:hypothetical protein
LRAPEIFFKILEKGKGKLVPLKEVAEVRFGIKTGANEFFYLTEEEIKRWKIEKEFWMHKDESGNWVPNYVIESAEESSKPQIEYSILKKRLLFVDKTEDKLKNKNVLRYIKYGEQKGFDKRPTCASRKPWYNLGKNINDIIAFPERIRLRHIVFYNPHRVSLNKNLYGIEPINKELAKVLSITLNSTIILLYLELSARQLGGGGGPLDIDVYVVKDILIPKEEILKSHKEKILDTASILKREIGSIFSELGAESPEEVSLEKVKSDRRKLDKIVMGEILDLTDEEQLEVYRAVIDLVKSRIERAKSVKNKKIVEGVDIDATKNLIIQEIDNEND